MTYDYPIEVHVGEHWKATFTVDLASWAGWTAKAQIRTHPGAAVLVELTCDTSVPGEVTVSVPTAATAALSPTSGYWDLLVKPTVGDPQYIVEGAVTISGRITVPA